MSEMNQRKVGGGAFDFYEQKPNGDSKPPPAPAVKLSTKFWIFVGPLVMYTLLLIYTGLPLFGIVIDANGKITEGPKPIYGKGFASFKSGDLFSWHPFLMVVGFITLAGNAAIIKQTKGKENMVMHGNLMSGAIICAFLGWYAIYDTKVFNNRLMGLASKSLHGQLGIFVMLGYLFIGIGGALAFHPEYGLKSVKESPYNATIRLVHKWSGRSLTALAWYTCVLGARKSFAKFTQVDGMSSPISFLWLEAPLLIVGLIVLLLE